MFRIVQRSAGGLTVLALFAAMTPPAQAAPKVVVSVAPIHSLVAAVMSGVGEPKLLVPANASPHAFSLRPSDARALAKAEKAAPMNKAGANAGKGYARLGAGLAEPGIEKAKRVF